MSYLGRSAKLSLKAQEKVSFLATAGQTEKTGLSYTPSFVEVYVNGVLLTDTTDFTATNGNSVTFTVALLLNDEVTVISLKTFTVADHYNKTEADTLLAAKATNTAVALKAPIATPVFTGDATVSTGNLVIGTNGKGIDFSANADSSATGASTTSELLDDYEEGTWTPVVTGSTGTPSSVTYHTNPSGNYTKVGRKVTIAFYLHINALTGGSGSFNLTGAPFAPMSSDGGFKGTVSMYYANSSSHSDPILQINSTGVITIGCANGANGWFSNVAWTNAPLSVFGTQSAMAGTLTYFV